MKWTPNKPFMNMSVGYGSHLPVLKRALDITTGPVLELGMGIISTTFLHWYCYPNKRKLVSCENDKTFAEAYFLRFQKPFHDIKICESWDDVDVSGQWSVALIDHAPPKRRIEEIKRLVNSVDYMVIHDTDKEQDYQYHYSEIWPLFKYRYDFKGTRPYTSIVSNLVDLSNFSLL